MLPPDSRNLPATELTHEPPDCASCGASIGVYEPLVYVWAHDAPVHSAFLKLPVPLRQAPERAAFYHVTCHQTVAAEPA
jgi:hypothetical protein